MPRIKSKSANSRRQRKRKPCDCRGTEGRSATRHRESRPVEWIVEGSCQRHRTPCCIQSVAGAYPEHSSYDRRYQKLRAHGPRYSRWLDNGMNRAFLLRPSQCDAVKLSPVWTVVQCFFSQCDRHVTLSDKQSVHSVIAKNTRVLFWNVTDPAKP